MIPIEMDDFKSYEDFKMYFDENIMALTSQKCDCRGLDKKILSKYAQSVYRDKVV